MRVLIADDEKDIRRLIVFTLERAGFEVVEARDGQDALDKVAQGEKPDIVLLDVMMPNLDGYEVCRRLRKIEVTATTPILFLSAKGQNYEMAEGLNAGATDYIVKPFIPRELAAKVKQMTGQAE